MFCREAGVDVEADAGVARMTGGEKGYRDERCFELWYCGRLRCQLGGSCGICCRGGSVHVDLLRALGRSLADRLLIAVDRLAIVAASWSTA